MLVAVGFFFGSFQSLNFDSLMYHKNVLKALSVVFVFLWKVAKLKAKLMQMIYQRPLQIAFTSQMEQQAKKSSSAKMFLQCKNVVHGPFLKHSTHCSAVFVSTATIQMHILLAHFNANSILTTLKFFLLDKMGQCRGIWLQNIFSYIML